MLKKQEYILDKVKTIIAHHEQLTRAKGEVFNIYNILNLKANEVRTHSSFIAELLNSQGTHLMGAVFLEEFLKLLPSEVFKDYLDTNSTSVTVEFYIAPVNAQMQTGGRIDVLLKDKNDHSIAIENKIDAYDLQDQVQRYYNYNTSKNKVVYLSKYGKEPSDESKGKLVSGIDYHNLSYQTHIIKWLEVCQVLASDQPIVRESIKQYKILIQQITHTLGNQQDQELKTIVKNNLEEADQIATKYTQVANEIKLNFRNNVEAILKRNLKDFTYTTKRDVDARFAGLWFHNEVLDSSDIRLGIQSFSGLGNLNGDLYVGIYSEKGNLLPNESYNPLNKFWPHHKVLKWGKDNINLSDPKCLKDICDHEASVKVAEDVVKQIICFVTENKKLLYKIKEYK